MIYDVLGVGFGPSNIALAIVMEESGWTGRAVFLERNPASWWHEGMLLDGSDIQNNLLRDLVTPVNPRSKYSFVNYLHTSGRFFHYLNLGRAFPLRRDFFDYVRWVAAQFEAVRYGVHVKRIEVERHDGAQVWAITSNDDVKYLARMLVLGTGRNLNIPPGLEESASIVHLSRYLYAIRQMPRSATVAVLGASQSAVEILLDLLDKGFERIYSIHRSFSYRLKDTSPFSEEVFFPEFIDYYHALPPEQRALLDEQVRPTNYSCADRDVIDALYTRLYEDRLQGRRRVCIYRNHDIVKAVTGLRLTLDIRDVYTDARDRVEADLLVLATGYLDVGRDGQVGLPRLLTDLKHTLSWTGGYLDVERDYRVRYMPRYADLPDLYLNGLCESSHGMGDAGSFSLVSFRARDILNSIRSRACDENRLHDLRYPEAPVRAS